MTPTEEKQPTNDKNERTMIKKAIHTAMLAAILATAAACRQDEEFEASGPQPKPGFVKIEFRADAPASEVQRIGTRAVDPDGGGVRDMTLFCFDNFGLFLTTVPATVDPKADDPANIRGDFTAIVPEYTRRIHFVANQNMTDFRESMFFNKTEAETMALMEGSAGQMIYWARFACPVIDPSQDKVTETIDKVLAKHLETEGSIKMLRNHAKITVGNPTNDHIVITGMAVYNGYVFGTVAPYDPVNGYNFTLEDWRNGKYVTIPSRDAKQTDIPAVTSNTHQYIFEHDNRIDDPVSVILRGHAPGQDASSDLYYRVMIYDNSTGEFLPVRRNHDYILTIQGKLSFGQPTFDEALTAPATNNVWISISDDVKEVEDNNYRLSVKETFIVKTSEDVATHKSMYVNYTLTAKGNNTLTTADQPSVTWLDNTLAAQEFRQNEFTITGNEGVGNIAIALRDLGSSERLEGTLLVKYKNLQRKVKLILIKQQTFVPSWISSGIYGGINADDKESRAHVTLLFTIPETCPAELFPMNVYITADELDIRNESGMVLPVVRNGDAEWHQSKDGPEKADYKFVYTVEQPGPQRVYFANILTHDADDKGTVYIEAPYFKTITRTFSFDSQPRAITVTNAGRYTATEAAGAAANEEAKDEYIYFYSVAQKKGAQVRLNVELHEKGSGDGTTEELGAQIAPNEKDEFFLYTQNLNNYVEMPTGAEKPGYGEYNPDKITLDCRYEPYTEKAAAWMALNNPEGGRMLMFKPINKEGLQPNDPANGAFTMRLYTNRAQSARLVRISSNRKDKPAVMPGNAKGGDGTDKDMYGGSGYRGFLLELVNYNPFRFGARVKYDNGTELGQTEEPDRSEELNRNRYQRVDIPETVTPLEWSYEPNKRVEIAFDVTSFEALADRETDNVSVDPFGQPFEIYIDAPMLKIDEGRLADYKLNGTKLKADPTVPGRFIYTVDGDRAAERAFGMAPALNVDSKAADQTGERKILPFIVKDIASAGDIVISSEKEWVVFYDKTFRVTNKPITGKIVAEMTQDDGTVINETVKMDEFVAFERTTNNNRIGVVTMTADGEFKLQLRKEFPLNWTSYPVAFHYEHKTADGKNHLHHARFESLAAMYEALKDGKGTVILKGETLRH